MTPTYTYRARLVRVVDGDTADLDVDLGFTVHVAIRVRFAGINCPERGKPGGAEATAYTRKWFTDHHDECTVTTTKTQDVYSRWLAVIDDPDPGDLEDSLNDLLVREGHAITDVYPKRH